MSVDKFGRYSSGQIYMEPGVSVRYVNNNFIRRDGSNEVEGDISMNNHKLVNLSGLVSNGGGCGNGMGMGWEWGRAHPFEISPPPPPRLSRKGALRARSSINAPLRDNRGACLERVC